MAKTKTEPVNQQVSIDGKGLHLEIDRLGNVLIAQPSHGELVTLSYSQWVWVQRMHEVSTAPVAGRTELVADGEEPVSQS